jgi:hypothetical protein
MSERQWIAAAEVAGSRVSRGLLGSDGCHASLSFNINPAPFSRKFATLPSALSRLPCRHNVARHRYSGHFDLLCLLTHLLFVLRHFMLAKNYAAPEAVPDGYATFNGKKLGHCTTSE